MIKYTPKQQSRADGPPKKDIEDYLFSWIPNEPSSLMGKLIHSIAINNVLAPFALLSFVLAIAALLVLAFGKNSDWNIVCKALVAVGLPILLIAMLTINRIGNIVLGIWMLLIYVAFVVITCWIMIPIIKAFFQPFINLF